MARYGMVINLDRCIGCYTCQIACKDEHVGNAFPPITKPQPTFDHFWIRIHEVERVLSPSHIRVHYITIPCQQCGDAPCMKEAKEDAIYRRQDGIVIIDPVKAAGQKQLVQSCPYEVIFWNEAENLPQKCTFCAHLLDDGWKEPRCVQTCPTGCLNFGDLDDPRSKVSKLLKEMKGDIFHREFEAKPNVYYIGLPKPHLSGTVIYGDKDQCAGNVTITLMGQGDKKRKIKTDFFGDFAFDGLGNKTYTVQFDARGYESQTQEVTLKDDLCYLGEIILNKTKKWEG